MEPNEWIYNLFLHMMGPAALGFLWSKSRGDPEFFRGRLGRYSPMGGNGRSRPRIWFHASSVGEVTGALPTMRLLAERLPQASPVLTVATPQGFRFARKQQPRASVIPFPLDFPGALTRAFDHIGPDLYVGFESEFWPNLFRQLKRRGVPAILLNGRLSRRSAARYRLLAPIFNPVFQHFSHMAMHSDEDRRNMLTLGIRRERTTVMGSSKYDGLLSKADEARAAHWRKVLGIGPEQAVVIGGSLRGSECVSLPEVFLGLDPPGESKLVGIFAPRHLDRIPHMARFLQQKGVAFQLLGSLEQGRESRHAPVVLVDRIGVLFELYGLGHLIFCGGSLEPIGGHNILEPAAWGKAVFYGPHTHKVAYEDDLLRRHGGSFKVENLKTLQTQWNFWLGQLPRLRFHGENARMALKEISGVVDKQVDLILDVLSRHAAANGGISDN